MDPTKQYFPVLLFITLYNFYLTFESVDDELQSVAGLSPNVWPFKWKWKFTMLYKGVQLFSSERNPKAWSLKWTL